MRILERSVFLEPSILDVLVFCLMSVTYFFFVPDVLRILLPWDIRTQFSCARYSRSKELHAHEEMTATTVTNGEHFKFQMKKKKKKNHEPLNYVGAQVVFFTRGWP